MALAVGRPDMCINLSKVQFYHTVSDIGQADNS